MIYSTYIGRNKTRSEAIRQRSERGRGFLVKTRPRIVSLVGMVPALFLNTRFALEISMIKMMAKKGFTLVELMVVIVIIGVLAAVAIPKFMQASLKAKASEFPTILTNISTSEAALKAETGTYSATMTDVADAADVTQMNNSKWFTYTVTAGSGVIASTFYATATGRTVAAGPPAVGDAALAGKTGIINEAGVKTGTLGGASGLVKTWQ